MKTKHYLNGVFRGKVKKFHGIESAIEKTAIDYSVYLFLEGLQGDECADQKNHGGYDRALHQYPFEHYVYWRQKYELDSDWQIPAMGENLSSIGMTEDTVFIGDRYQWGQAIIEVSQPRSPCFKLNKRLGIEEFSVHMQEVSRCGWLYRVITSGMVSVSQPLELIDRVPNALSVRQACELYFGDPLNRTGLLLLQKQKRLAESWQKKIRQRLATGELENWNFRLLGHA